MESLAEHLIDDAPLLWLRYLLVPMFAQWSQLHGSWMSKHAAAGSAEAEASLSGSATELSGASTMLRLLHALSTFSLRAALRREKKLADELQSRVRELSHTPDTDAISNNNNNNNSNIGRSKRTGKIDPTCASMTRNEESKAASPSSRPFPSADEALAREAVADIHRRQRQHVGELLCFTGTLARTTQSFALLSGGGLTLLMVFVVRLLGHAQAAWGEWARTRTAAEFGHDRPSQTTSTRTALHPLELRPGSLRNNSGSSKGVEGEEEEEDTHAGRGGDGGDGNSDRHHHHHPQQQQQQQLQYQYSSRKRVRDETVTRTEAIPSTTATTAAAPASTTASLTDSFASLRLLLVAAARRYAAELWRCWWLLFGFYGTDLYTNDVVARALDEEEVEIAGVHCMSPAQQAQWWKTRLAARVKQHALSETHWLWCRTATAYVEAFMAGVFVDDDDDDGDEASNDGSTAALYRRTLADTARIFFDAVQDVLTLYGQAMLAQRSGGLQSATAVAPATLQSVLCNTLGTQAIVPQFLVNSICCSTDAAIAKAHGTHLQLQQEQQQQQQQQWCRQMGVYAWVLGPTLLRTQPSEEVSWMGSGVNSTVDGCDIGGAGGAGEVSVGELHELHHSAWRRCGTRLADVLSDTAARMAWVLRQADKLDVPSANAATANDNTSNRRSVNNNNNKTTTSTIASTATAARSAAQQDSGSNCDDATLAGYAGLIQVFDEVVFDDDLTRSSTACPRVNGAASTVNSTSSLSSASAPVPVNSVAYNFYAFYDASCFFVLRPERQRLFTRSIQKLCELVTASAGVTSSLSAISEVHDDPFLASLRGDTRLWMLLAHGVLVQLERRGRLAREDEALLVTGLLPLLSVLSSRATPVAPTGHRQSVGHDPDASEDLTRDSAGGVLAWADLASMQDLLLLLGSGMLNLPWDLEQLYLVVQRHTFLCARFGQPTLYQRVLPAAETSFHAALSPDAYVALHANLRKGVARMLQWFTADTAASPGAAAAATAATADVWSLPGTPLPRSATAASPTAERSTTSFNAAAAAAAAADAPRSHQLADPMTRMNNSNNGNDNDLRWIHEDAPLGQICADMDRYFQQRDALLLLLHADDEGPPHSGGKTAKATTSSTPGAGAATAVEGVDEEVVEGYINAALDSHGEVAAPFTASGACGLLIILGAYRSLSRALYRLRVALEEQLRMAREDDVGEFVGRSVTYCTSVDIQKMRVLVTLVHRSVFAGHAQPRGLLRLWLGYLQQLFLCVVPLASNVSGAADGGVQTGEEEALTLMPASWQQSHHVQSLFGGRVYRTGWRALQHDGEPPSHTRLREVLGECLADLLVLPYHSTDAEPLSCSTSAMYGGGDYTVSRPPTSAMTTAHATRRLRTAAVLQHTFPHAVAEVLCEMLAIPLDNEDDSEEEGVQESALDFAGTATTTITTTTTTTTTTTAKAGSSPSELEERGSAIKRSFLGLAGFLALLRRVELLVVPGTLRDRRLAYALRRMYAAADAAALGM